MHNQAKHLKRISRNPEKYDILELFDAIACNKKLNFSDEDDVINIIKDALKKNKSPIMLYGKQTEAMFAFIVAALSKTILIKKEDGGSVFFNEDSINIPDYRIILSDGVQILIEVKNCYCKSLSHEFCIKTESLLSLKKYADLMQIDLKIAIYWAKTNAWTLVSKEDFSPKGNNSTISFCQALKQNKMSILGDIMIGTTPPLAIKLYASQQDQAKKGNNSFGFTIEKVELSCNNQLITNDNESKIAFKLILFGDWEEEFIPSINKDNKIEYIKFQFNPIEKNQEQDFNIIGTLSSIISRQYMQYTSPNGLVERFSPNINPKQLGLIIPNDYKGDVLKLWRFIVN